MQSGLEARSQADSTRTWTGTSLTFRTSVPTPLQVLEMPRLHAKLFKNSRSFMRISRATKNTKSRIRVFTDCVTLRIQNCSHGLIKSKLVKRMIKKNSEELCL